MTTEGEITGAMERFGIGREEAKTVEYIGDGVYASHDGWHIWLRTLEGMAVALEPEVFQELNRYVGRLSVERT